MALQKQEMIDGVVTKYWEPSTSKPGSFLVTRNDNGEKIRFTIWLNRETGEKPAYLWELENQLGDVRLIEGLSVVGTVRFARNYDGVKQYNLNNIKLINAPTRVNNTNTNNADKSIEGIVLGNGKSVGAILSEPYLEYWLAHQPKGHIVSEEEHAAKALEIMNLIVPGICAMDGSRVTDVEEFENIQTEEIVPSEDSDMPDDTGAIEL